MQTDWTGISHEETNKKVSTCTNIKGALSLKTVFTCIFWNVLGPYVFVLCSEYENELLPPLSALATEKKKAEKTGRLEKLLSVT